MQQMIFIADLTACSTARKPDTQPSAPHHTDNLKTRHQIRQAATTCLTLNLLTTTIVAPPSNASKWQMGFNSAFKGLILSSS